MQLPLPAFARFVSSHDSPLEDQVLVAIFRLLLPSLLPPNSPEPYDVDANADASEGVSPPILQECYLPFAYRTADNNAKISIAVENLFRIMWTNKVIRWTPEFGQAVKKGIKAREEKSAPKRSRKDDDSEQAAREILRASASRLSVLTEFLKAQTT